jgi:hypothetical protein
MKACREDNFGWTGFDVGEKGAWQIGVEKHGNWWQMVLLMIKRWKWGGCYLVFFFFFLKKFLDFFTLFIGYIYIYIYIFFSLGYCIIVLASPFFYDFSRQFVFVSFSIFFQNLFSGDLFIVFSPYIFSPILILLTLYLVSLLPYPFVSLSSHSFISKLFYNLLVPLSQKFRLCFKYGKRDYKRVGDSKWEKN